VKVCIKNCVVAIFFVVHGIGSGGMVPSGPSGLQPLAQSPTSTQRTQLLKLWPIWQLPSRRVPCWVLRLIVEEISCLISIVRGISLQIRKNNNFAPGIYIFGLFFYFKFFFKLIDGFGRMWAVRSALSVCYESYTHSPLTEFSSLESDVVYVIIYLMCLSVGLGHMFFWLFPRLIDFQRYKESGTRLISPKNEPKKSGINFTTDFTPRFKTPDMTPPKFSTEMTPPKFSENGKSSEFSSEFSAESNISKGPFQSLQNPLMGQGGEMSAPKRKRNRLCFILIWLWSTFFFFTDGFGRVWAQFAVFEAIILFNKHPIAFVPFFVPALFVSFCGGMFVLYEKWQTNFGSSAKKMKYRVLDVPT